VSLSSQKNVARKKRQARVRKKVRGVADRPRLSVFRSARHIYAQVIDDTSGSTLISASTLDAKFKANESYTGNVSAAAGVGTLIAEKALEEGITKVVFDRNGFLYHGRIKALADAAREKGLAF
jgi:large subunit ribosomal protein L18